MSELLLGRDATGQPLHLPLKTMLRHAVCLGSSGSGKTVACKVIVEEYIRRGIPVIAVDPQGDIASLARVADEETVVAKGTPAEVRTGFLRKAQVVVWTPGSALGVPISVNPLAATSSPSGAAAEGQEEELLRDIAFAAEGLADLAGFDLKSKDGRYVTALFGLVIRFAADHGKPLEGIGPLLKLLSSMPKELADQVSSVVSEKLSDEVVRRLRMLTMGPQSLMLTGGVPLDVDTLLGRNDEELRASGRARLSVVYLNTLGSDRERQFFLGQLAQAVYRWMLEHPSTTPQALFYVDEVAPYIPPVRKPVCKDALKLLLRQARKYGLSCLLATQSPGDIDYTALSQIGTWNLGRLMTRQELKKVQSVLESIAPTAAEEIAAELPSLKPGQFRLVCPDAFKAPVSLRVRWLVTEHRTLDDDGIASATDPDLRADLERLAGIDEEPGHGGPASPVDESDPSAGPAVGRAEVAVLAVTGDGEGDVNACEIVVQRGGNGKITALGGQTRVSKEAIKVAWEAASLLLRQNAIELPREFDRRYDVTVLDTRLAVKKDGPSAGLAYLTGIIAALRERAPRRDVAMTGEITMLGKVLEVGGIEEKAKAAYEAGYATIVVPAENKGDVAMLPRALRDAIEVVPVATIVEALPVIFGKAKRERPVPPEKPLDLSGEAEVSREEPAAKATPAAPAAAPATPTPVAAPVARPEPPDEPKTSEDRVLALLAKEPTAFDYDEITERVEDARNTVTRAVRKLLKGGLIRRAKRGRKHVHYHADHALLPDWDLLGPVEAVKLAVFEPDARRRAEKDLATSMLVFTREEVASLALGHLPIYRLKFSAKVTEGWIFTRTVERRDCLYFNGLTGDLLTFVKGTGFSFEAETPANPVEVVDLDDLACLETAMPGELELLADEMNALVGAATVEKAAAKKFDLEVLEIDLVFLPVWRALIRDKENRSERDLFIDGYGGHPMALPRPARSGR